VPLAAMAPLERGKQRRCSGYMRGALDFMGAYATPPGDIDPSAPASGMPGRKTRKTTSWNKELTICDMTRRSSTRTVAMQQRFFPHHSCTVADDFQGATARQRTSFSSTPQVLTRIIKKGDDAHCDFRLDFRDAIAHCHLVQRNNVA